MVSSVTAAEMRNLEAAAFRRGVAAGTLMDQAGDGMARWLLHHFPQPGRAIAFVGKGNNGGDALVVLDILRQHGWRIALRTAFSSSKWTT
ncbi:MAG: NAD(P)H-hydrate epimerase, partial [Verrucomicrobiales bacterium]